ncbi:hypothetical protein [Stutzerimonas degradans]|nr:hypothetical protein [Stutzerimonas degradans]
MAGSQRRFGMVKNADSSRRRCAIVAPLSPHTSFDQLVFAGTQP